MNLKSSSAFATDFCEAIYLSSSISKNITILCMDEHLACTDSIDYGHKSNLVMKAARVSHLNSTTDEIVATPELYYFFDDSNEGAPVLPKEEYLNATNQFKEMVEHCRGIDDYELFDCFKTN